MNKNVYRTKLCNIKIGLKTLRFLKSDFGKAGRCHLSSEKTRQHGPTQGRVTGDVVDQPAALYMGHLDLR